VPEQLIGASSATDINAEADGQEGLEILAELLRLLETRSSVGSNQVQRFEWLLVEIRWLRLDHLNCHDSERPDIDLRAIFLLLYDFWSHPVWCTDHGGTLGLGLSKLGAETKISDLDVSSCIQKYIVTLDITMDDVLLMQML
jgi:hypothetical protein